ncbi:hypothetical protein EH240_17830 [Mesorhizobium tamadayense]|uniref:Uncharacterized protein n=1 Tax=Mesorhizobium tamadayense TaxID=425306 RepID=A0A3P3FMP8_9HYPH|nr:hypothetical protein [Mesorhizobium tamadayense]RRH99667.1 hypothetical protein EH240_17830 [Mesorhizobium tamadayense]
MVSLVFVSYRAIVPDQRISQLGATGERAGRGSLGAGKMAVELAGCNEEAQETDAVAALIAAHRQAMAKVESLGNRLMQAEEAEAALIGPRLDAVMAEEAVVRRQAAMAPVADVCELKMKAAHFERLMNDGWCDVDSDDLHELLRSFVDLPI